MMTPNEKIRRLEEYLSSAGGVFVAYSAGVDSTFLLKIAHDVLGDKAAAVTAASPFFPPEELEAAQSFCRSEGIEHIILSFDPLSEKDISANPPDRCYLCKKKIFSAITAHRELGIESPLKLAGLSKSDIRVLSSELSLSTWDKPALACLATRIATGETLTEEKLDMIGRAERYIRSLGFRQIRVRMHGSLARIETDIADIPRICAPDTAQKIHSCLKELGFSYVSLDLGGYKTGSMNKVING